MARKPDSPIARAGARRKVRTAWHPMAYTLVKSFTPAGWEALEEFSLGQLPQRIDILLLQRTDAPPGPVEGLDCIMNRLNRFVIIEVKSPTDRLEAQDLPLLLGYAYQLMVVKGVARREEVTLITLSDGISEPFRERLSTFGARMESQETGVWRHEGLELPSYSIDTALASELPGNHLLCLFTRRFHRDRVRMAGLLNDEEHQIFVHLYQRMIQLTGEDEGLRMEGYAVVKKELEEIYEEILPKLPLELRLKVLKGLKPEERLQGLKPEERLQGLSLEEIARALTPEQLEKLKTLPH